MYAINAEKMRSVKAISTRLDRFCKPFSNYSTFDHTTLPTSPANNSRILNYHAPHPPRSPEPLDCGLQLTETDVRSPFGTDTRLSLCSPASRSQLRTATSVGSKYVLHGKSALRRDVETFCSGAIPFQYFKGTDLPDSAFGGRTSNEETPKAKPPSIRLQFKFHKFVPKGFVTPYVTAVS